MSGVALRAPRRADLDALVALVRACELAESGEAESTRASMAEEWARPRFDPDRDAWLAVDGSGAPVGYAEVYDESACGDFLGSIYVHPTRLERGVAAGLLARMEARCRGQTLHVVHLPENEPMAALLERSGYRHVRSFYRMAIELSAPLAAPVWPAGIEVRGFRAGDAGAVHAVVDEAFAGHFRYERSAHDEWRVEYLERSDSRPDAWILAWDGAELCGVAVNSEHCASGGWVSKLAVRPAWRGRGLGRALLLASFERFRALGWTRAYLGVDARNQTGALRLYERAGMKPVQRYDFWRKRVLSSPAHER